MPLVYFQYIKQLSQNYKKHIRYFHCRRGGVCHSLVRRPWCRWFILNKLGRYPRGSGARTVVARLPVGGPSGTRRGGPPRRSHSLFEARFATPTRPASPAQWDLIFPSGTCEAPTGTPSGRSAPPSGSFARSHWEGEAGRGSVRGWHLAPRRAAGARLQKRLRAGHMPRPKVVLHVLRPSSGALAVHY